MLFGDANVEILIGQGLLEQVEAGAGGHGGGNAHHCRVLLTELDQGLAKYLAVARRFRFAGGVGLAGCQVEGALGVVSHLIGLRIGVTLALGGGHMHQHGTFSAMGLLKGAHHPGDVMAIDRADVGEAQLLEHGSHLGNRQALHALFESFEFIGQLAVQEGQVLDRLLRIALQELQGRTQPHPVQVGGEGPHRRADRHVVVVEHHDQLGFRQVAGMVDRLQGHATGEGAIADHRYALEILAAAIPGQGHPQGSRDGGAGMAGAEMVKAALTPL